MKLAKGILNWLRGYDEGVAAGYDVGYRDGRFGRAVVEKLAEVNETYDKLQEELQIRRLHERASDASVIS